MARVISRSGSVGMVRCSQLTFGFVKHQLKVVSGLADLFLHHRAARRRSPTKRGCSVFRTFEA